MLTAIVLAARWTVRRFGATKTFHPLLGVGLVALALLLTMELTVVLTLRGLTLSEYLRSRDPVAGGVYVLLLTLFAMMPLLLGRQARLSA